MTAPADLLKQGIQEAQRGHRTQARNLLIRVAEAEPGNELAWVWLAGLMDSLEDRLIACENVLALNPANDQIRTYMYRLLREHKAPEAAPMGVSAAVALPTRSYRAGAANLRTLAVEYEAQGRLDDAIRTLADLASLTTDSGEFDRIYREITRLESLEREQIQHIAPASTVLRMTLSWPLLYLFLAVVQTGLRPFMAGAWYLWAGLPAVGIGAFLLALIEVRAPHPAWRLFAGQDANGSGAERLVAAAAGWLLVGVPHLLLLLDSLSRLSAFRVPYPPLPGG